MIGESADGYTHSSYSGNDDMKEKVLVRTISNLNERATRNNHELPHFHHTQKYLIDKEEYLNVDLIKIEANSGSPSITSHDFPYSYGYYPIELEAPKSVQNVDIDDENASLNFTSKLEPDSCPNRAREPVDIQTLSNNLIAYDHTALTKVSDACAAAHVEPNTHMTPSFFKIRN